MSQSNIQSRRVYDPLLRILHWAIALSVLALVVILTVYATLNGSQVARSLSEVLREDGPLPPHRVARIGLDVLGALETSHKQGVVHRGLRGAQQAHDRLGQRSLDAGRRHGVGDDAGESAEGVVGVVRGAALDRGVERGAQTPQVGLRTGPVGASSSGRSSWAARGRWPAYASTRSRCPSRKARASASTEASERLPARL